LPRLFEELGLAKASGTYAKTLAKLGSAEVLVLDDLGIKKIVEAERNDLLEVLEDRYGRSSTVVTRQLPVSTWHEWLADPTAADAIWTASCTTPTSWTSKARLGGRNLPSNHQRTRYVASLRLRSPTSVITMQRNGCPRWPTYAFGPTLACEKLRELHGIAVSVETLPLWMTQAGIWTSHGATAATATATPSTLLPR
jgi:hypothetical protein